MGRFILVNIMGTLVSQDKNPFPLATTHPTSTKTQKPSVSHIQPHSLTPKLPHTDIMGAVVSCFESICRTIGSVLMAIVNGIGSSSHASLAAAPDEAIGQERIQRR